MNDYVHKVDDSESARIQRFLYTVAIGTVVFVILIIVAVATAHLWVRLVSHASERRFMEPHVTWVNEHLFDAGDPVLQDYVERVGSQVASHMSLPADLELEFFVVDGDIVNAFTTLGGYIFVFEGLLHELDNENSLAMVLGHEIAHAGNRDPLTAAGRGILVQVMISSLSGSGGMDPSQAAGLGSDIALNLYSRDQEEAADRWALQALAARYGHVGGATQLFEQLDEDYGDEDLPAFLASHPDLADRIAAIESAAGEQGWAVQPTAPYPPEVVEALSSRP